MLWLSESVLRSREDAHSSGARPGVSDGVLSVRDRVPSPPRAAPAQPSQLAPDTLSYLPVPLRRVLHAREPPQITHEGTSVPLRGLSVLVKVQQRAEAAPRREGSRARLRAQRRRQHPGRRSGAVRAGVAAVDPTAPAGDRRRQDDDRFDVGYSEECSEVYRGRDV